MRSASIKAAVLVILVGFSGGCSTMSDTAKGAGIGGAIGTGAGLLAGAATGNPRTGAVVGGLLGAGVGGAVGNASDNEKAERREIQQAVATAEAQQAGGRLGMIDVVQLVAQGNSPDVIVNQIHSTGSTFQLSTNDLTYLRQNNVPDPVIIAMQNSKPRPTAVVAAPRAVVVREPYWYDRPYYYGPPPPAYVGVRFGPGCRHW